MSKLMTGVLVSLVMGATTYTTKLQTNTSMNIQRTSLWELIETLGGHPSLLPDRLRQVLPVEFSEHRRSAYSSFYDGGPLGLGGKIDIKAVFLRVRNENETQGMVSLYLNGTCVALDEVRAHYPGVIITGTPRGHSLDEETYWSIWRPWGKLSFGFKERNPKCLASVVLDRSKLLPATTPP